MKRVLLVGIGVIAFSAQAHADLPTIDFSNLIAQAKNLQQSVLGYELQAKQWATANLSWVEDVKQTALQGQIFATDALMLDNFVRNPNLGAAMGLLNLAGLGNSLPVTPYAVMSVVNGLSNVGNGTFSIASIPGVLGSLSSMAGQSYAAIHVYSPTDGSWNSQQLIARGNAIAGEQGTALSAYQDYRKHADALQSLRTQLTTASSPKNVQDIQAEIAVEQVWTQNMQGQMAAIAAASRSQQAAQIQRDNESWAKGTDDFLAQANAQGMGI